MKKLMFGILVAFSVVSVSMGAYIPKSDKENYQKLKAEVEMYDDGKECKYNEKGQILGVLCRTKNVVAFFDEIQESKEDGFYEAVEKVREIPRFKNDSGIYGLTRAAGNLKVFWENVWRKWEAEKSDLEIDGARRGYWKKLAE